MISKAIALSALLLFLPICSNAAGNQHAKANVTTIKFLNSLNWAKPQNKNFLKDLQLISRSVQNLLKVLIVFTILASVLNPFPAVRL